MAPLRYVPRQRRTGATRRAQAARASAMAVQLLLAGFDGYPSDDPRKVEMDEMLSLFQKFSSKVKILSITPTKYNLDSISIYAL